MPFKAVCPHCDARQSVPDSARGKKTRCEECDESFVARPVRRDDGPRSRPKKSGPPVLLFVLLGVGLLMLVGGGIAAAMYFKGGKQPGGGGGSGETAAAPPASTAGWIDFVDADAKFRVKFPKAPRVTDETEYEDGEKTGSHKAAVTTDPVINCYAASHPLKPGADPQYVLEREMNNAPGPRPWNGLVERRTAATHAGKPGRQLILNNAPDTGVLWMFVSNNRFYVLMVWGRGVKPEHPMAAAFLQSLAFD